MDGPHLFELMLKPQVAKENCQFALLPLGAPLIKESPVVRILCSLYFRWVPKVVRSTLLHFSLPDGPTGRNPKFYEFVCIWMFGCKIKANLLEHQRQLTIVILVDLLSFQGQSSFVRFDVEKISCKGKLSFCRVLVKGLSLLRRAPMCPATPTG